ncbi:MAG: hypothetical protein JJD98_06130 [Polaromonas sp.]|nr:hypothetical protein [Polaromonas sp.]
MSYECPSVNRFLGFGIEEEYFVDQKTAIQGVVNVELQIRIDARSEPLFDGPDGEALYQKPLHENKPGQDEQGDQYGAGQHRYGDEGTVRHWSCERNFLSRLAIAFSTNLRELFWLIFLMKSRRIKKPLSEK